MKEEVTRRVFNKNGEELDLMFKPSIFNFWFKEHKKQALYDKIQAYAENRVTLNRGEKMRMREMFGFDYMTQKLRERLLNQRN